jgi:ATP-dependent Clp protease ATP-binding subunit ClpC
MGARPLRRAIQRYIEDPLADEVLSQSMPPGSTIEVDKGPEGDEEGMKISIVKGKERTREAVGVGAKGGPLAEGSDEPEQPSGDSAPDLPEEPEVLPDVPDAPPAEEE